MVRKVEALMEERARDPDWMQKNLELIRNA